MDITFLSGKNQEKIVYKELPNNSKKLIIKNYNTKFWLTAILFVTLSFLLLNYKRYGENNGEFPLDRAFIIVGIIIGLLVMLAFSSSMSLSTESIAGEKERGTLATIFVTPIKKVDVAFGKIFALSIISTISVLISTTTAVLSLSNITDSDVKINDYGWQLYILIFFVMLVTIHLFIVILLIISALSRNPKESQTSSIPLMLIVLLAGMSTMIENINVFNGASYLIPVYNSILSLRLILGNTLSIGIVITLCVNLFITILGIIFLSKLLEREKILFAS